MPVFTKKRMDIILTNFRELAGRACAAYPAPDITAEELLRALVRRRHYEAIKLLYDDQALAYQLGGVTFPAAALLPLDSILLNYAAGTPKAPGQEFRVHVNFTAAVPFLLPGYVEKDGFHDEADPITVEKFRRWLEGRFKLGVRLASARLVFEELNETCLTAAQMKFFFPGVMALLHGPGLESAAHRIREARAGAQLPTFSKEFRGACADATNLMSQIQLVSAAPVPRRAPLEPSFRMLRFTHGHWVGFSWGKGLAECM